MAQATTAEISGTVTDSTGAVVPNAVISAVNLETNLVRTVDANQIGEYIIRFLPTGTYRVEVSHPGFKKYEQTGVVLDIGRNARIDPLLQVGAQTEQVVITADAPLVNTTDATVGQITSTTDIVNMPLLNHDVYQLLNLTPGVSGETQSSTYGFPEYHAQVNGSAYAQIAAIGYFLDGGYNMNNLEGGGLTAPSPDALQEFRVTTSNYSAEYGRYQGAMVDVVLKSGTNSIHGSLFEYFRNDKLNAYGWGTVTKPVQRRNQFGATEGGRIIKDKTFYYLSYQGTREQGSTGSTSAVVPTALERQGNFSASKIQPKDPTNGALFAGGIIPMTRFDPVALKILNASVPAADLPGNRVQVSEPLPNDANEGSAKVDQYISAKHLLTFSYFTTQGHILASLPGNLIWVDRTFSWKQQNFNVNETWTINSSTVNQLHLGYLRDFGGRVNATSPYSGLPASIDSLGALGSTFNVQGPPSLPNISVSGYFTLGNAIQGPVAGDNFFQIRDTVSTTHGRHTFKVGLDGSMDKSYQDTDLNNYGTFSFNGSTTGNALADFYVGLPLSFNQDSPENKVNATWYAALFAQDDFRINQRLTLNLGVRWDLQTPFYEPRNQTDTFVPGVQSRVVPGAPTGELFPGDSVPGFGVIPRGLFHAQTHLFSPRVGLAYDLFGDRKTSFRAGFGQFYSSMSGNEMNSVHDAQPFTVRQTFPRVQNASLRDPYADLPGDASPFPYIFTPNNPRYIYPTSISGIGTDFFPAYTFQLNATLQRQLTSTLSVSAGYVGSLGRHLPLDIQYNYPTFPAAVCSSTLTTNCASASNYNARRPLLPNILGSVTNLEGVVNTDYHGLQMSLEKRLSHNIYLKGYYIWGKGMEGASLQSNTVGGVLDPRNNKLDRARTVTDAKNTFVMSAIWRTNYLPAAPAFVREVINGWAISPIVTIHSGYPFTVSTGVDNNLDGSTSDRPNQIGNPVLPTNRPRSQLVAMWFNPAAFASPSYPTDGSAGRDILNGPGYKDVDMAISRDFQIRERFNLQFRAEATNAFNLVNLNSPVSTLSSGNVGQITGAGSMRQGQLGLRLTF